MGRRNHARFGNTVRFPSGTDGSYDTLGTQRNSAAFSQLSSLIASALIPTRDGTVTVTSTATVDPITGAAVGANTANGRDLWIGNQRFPGAALRAERATTGVMGGLNVDVGLASNSTIATPYPTVRVLTEDASTGGHSSRSGFQVVTDATNYAISACIAVKPGAAARGLYFYLGGASSEAGVFIDPSTGGLTSNTFGTGSVVRSSARLLSSGFWFVQVAVSATTWGGSVAIRCAIRNGATSTYTGDGVSGIQIAGYQCELGDYATMPLAWDGSAGVSRVAQSNSWNQSLSLTAGTVFAVGMPYGRSGAQGVVNCRLYDTLGTVGIGIYQPATQFYDTRRVDSLATQRTALSAATPAVAGQQKICTQRWDSTVNTNRTTVDGATTSSTVGTPPWAAATAIQIGNNLALGAEFDGWVCPIIFTTALSDSDVALLTANSYIA